jgi:hypothetical protein
MRPFTISKNITNITNIFIIYKFISVPKERLELSNLTAIDPKSIVSTNSTIRAIFVVRTGIEPVSLPTLVV